MICAGMLAPAALGARAPRIEMQGASPASVEAISACRAIAASDARLACFDKAAAALDDAIKTHDVTVLDKRQVATTKRSLFGFTIPNITLFNDGKSDNTRENAELDSVITSVRNADYGHYDMTIGEGAVWRNTDPLDSAPRTGSMIHIKRGLIGNFFLKIGNEHPVRGMRVR